MTADPVSDLGKYQMNKADVETTGDGRGKASLKKIVRINCMGTVCEYSKHFQGIQSKCISPYFLNEQQLTINATIRYLHFEENSIFVNMINPLSWRSRGVR